MVVNKRKKADRFRAHTTHGWGSKKKHRGSGNRGGKGWAGSGKRADQKKSLVLKLYGREYFGKHGFVNPNSQAYEKKGINLSDIDSKLEYYVEQKLVKKEGDSFIIDLKKLGFDKLLGKGNISRKIKITAPSFSKLAVEKIKEKGGEVIGAE